MFSRRMGRGCFSRRFQILDLERHEVLVLRGDFDAQSGSRVRAEARIDAPLVARLKVGDIFGHHHLDDHAIVLADDGSIIGFVGGQAEDAIVVDGSSRLDFVVPGLDFDRTDMHGRTIGKENLASNGIGGKSAVGTTGETQHS